MVQTETEVKPHKITCIHCNTKHDAKLEDLKFRPGMKPFVCPLCAKGIKMGNVSKLEKFVLEHYEVKGTIVDFVISKLNKDLLTNL